MRFVFNLSLNYRDSRFSNFQVSCCAGQFQFADCDFQDEIYLFVFCDIHFLSNPRSQFCGNLV